MANQEVKVFFKVEGIDDYITDLNELQAALNKTDTDTEQLSSATDKLATSQEKAQGEVNDTKKTINSLNEELNKLQKELNETEVGSDAFNELTDKVKEAEDAIADAKAGTSSFGDKLGDVPGPVGNITKGVKGLGTALKALLANPIVLVIAAVVAALTALFKAFTSTKEGAEAFDRVLAGISAAVDVVRDRVLQFAGAIAKFFSGDFTGAFEQAKDAVSGIGAEIAAEAQEAARLTGVLQKNADDIRALNVERAEQNALLAENKLKIDDTTLSIEERQAALEEATTAETALLEKELTLQKERLSALEALAEQSDSDSETLDELAQQRILIAQLEEQSLNKQTELLGKRKALVAEQAAIDKAAADEAARLRKEREDAAKAQLDAETKIIEEIRRARLEGEAKELDDLKLQYEERLKVAKDNAELRVQIEEDYERRKQAVEDKYDAEEKTKLETQQQAIQDILDTYAQQEFDTEEQRLLAELEQRFNADQLKLQQAGATTQQLLELENRYEQDKTKITKKAEDDRAKLRKENITQAVQLTQGVFGALQALNDARTAKDEKEAKKQFERNKKFSIAQALISTGLAVNAALTAGGNPVKLATGAQFVEAGIALATGLAQVAKIKATQFNSGGGGGEDTIEQPTFDPQAAINARNQQLTGLQDAGQAITPGQTSTGGAIRAYVVATEVTSQQEANNQVENLSRL